MWCGLYSKAWSKPGLPSKDMAVGFVEESGEQVSDLLAEAKAEHYAKPEA